MRSVLFVALVLLQPLYRPAHAQAGSQPSIVLTIFGGNVTGHHVWTVEKQPLSVLGSSLPTKYDTLHLVRSSTASLVLGATGTYFLSPQVGVHAEISYIGLPFDNDCNPLFLHPDSSGATDLRRNGQACDDIRSQSISAGAITVFGGVTLRAASRGSFSPYLRGNAGIVNLSQSSIDVAGAFLDSDGTIKVRQVVADPKPSRISILLGVAAGFSTPIGPGYQFRLELRDQVIQLTRLTGPGSAGGPSPTAKKFYHHGSLTLGLDVVLEKKRGRRY